MQHQIGGRRRPRGVEHEAAGMLGEPAEVPGVIIDKVRHDFIIASRQQFTEAISDLNGRCLVCGTPRPCVLGPRDEAGEAEPSRWYGTCLAARLVYAA